MGAEDDARRQYRFSKQGRGSLSAARVRYFALESESIVWRTAPGAARQGSVGLADVTEVSLIGTARGFFSCVLRTRRRTYHLETAIAAEARAFTAAVVAAARSDPKSRFEQTETAVVYRRADTKPTRSHFASWFLGDDDRRQFDDDDDDDDDVADTAAETPLPERQTPTKEEDDVRTTTPPPGMLRTWSRKELAEEPTPSSTTRTRSRRLPPPALDDDTAMYQRIRERQWELRETRREARARATREAAQVAAAFVDANLDALALRSAFRLEEAAAVDDDDDAQDSEGSALRAIAEQLDERLKAAQTRLLPRLKYASQLLVTATRAYRASLLAGWAGCSPARAHLKPPHDTANWEKRWADELGSRAAATTQPVWLHLGADGVLRAYLLESGTFDAKRELGGYPMTDALDDDDDDAKGVRQRGVLEHQGRALQCTLGRRCLRLERAVAVGPHASRRRDDAEALATVAADAALREDCRNGDSRAPSAIVVDEDLTLRVSPKVASVPREKPATVASLLFSPSGGALSAVDATLPDACLELRLRRGKRVRLTAPTVQAASAWAAAIEAAADSAQSNELALELDLRDAVGVRPSRAPRAPKFALDLVVSAESSSDEGARRFSELGSVDKSDEDVYTFLLGSDEDRTRWLVALDKAISKGRRRRRRRRTDDLKDQQSDDPKEEREACGEEPQRETPSSPTPSNSVDVPAERAKQTLLDDNVEKTTRTKKVDTETENDDDDALQRALRAAATCENEAAMDAATTVLARLESEAMRRAASARDAAVDLRRRRAALQETSYLSKAASQQRAVKKCARIEFSRRGAEPRGDALEAKELKHLLARGALVVVQLRVDVTSHTRFEYFTIDPSDDDGSLEDRDDLVEDFLNWRRASNFSTATDEATWRAAVDARLAKQADRWMANLAALDVLLANASAVVFCRLLDAPDEYAMPPRDGDVGVVWSGGVQDGGFDVSFRDRARTAAPVVGACISWLDSHNVLAQRFLRTDSSTTDQDEASPLAYARVMRVLFQQALVR